MEGSVLDSSPPSGENLAPPARIRRLETGRSGEQEQGGGGGGEEGGKRGVNSGNREEGEICEMQAGD